MTEAIVQRIAESATHVAGLYHRLLLLVGPSGAGKSAALQRVAAAQGVAVINLNLELSRALLDVPRAQRSMTAPRALRRIADCHPGDTMVADNIEILFAPDLRLDPLRALQQLSRNRTVIAAWLGSVDCGRLTYAKPSHPEFRDYSAQDLVTVSVAGSPLNAPP
ncbi:MAG: BREX-3 system P-loop-containing protein BrxF [Acidobacteriota bacterium]